MNLFNYGEPVINGTIYPHLSYSGYYVFIIDPLSAIIVVGMIIVLALAVQHKMWSE